MTTFGNYMDWGCIIWPNLVWLALLWWRYCKEQFHFPLTGSHHLWPMYKRGGLNGSNIGLNASLVQLLVVQPRAWSRQSRKFIFVMQPYFNPARRDTKKWWMMQFYHSPIHPSSQPTTQPEKVIAWSPPKLPANSTLDREQRLPQLQKKHKINLNWLWHNS